MTRTSKDPGNFLGLVQFRLFLNVLQSGRRPKGRCVLNPSVTSYMADERVTEHFFPPSYPRLVNTLK